MLVSPSRNPILDQSLEAQIEYYNPDISWRQLTARLKQCTKGGRRYKAAYRKSTFSSPNAPARREHAKKYKGKTVEDTYQSWAFPDEAHFDPGA